MEGTFVGEPEGHPDHEMRDTEVPIVTQAIEAPEIVLPSVESGSDAAITAAESEFLTVSASDTQFRGQFPPGINEVNIQITNGARPGYGFPCNFLRKMRQAFAEKFPGLQTPVLSTSLIQDFNIPALQNGPSNSLLDDMLTLRSVRSIRRRNPRFSPPRRLPPSAHAASPTSNRVTGDSRVLKAQQATPIRRSRSSYSIISQSRRTEASGRIDRTLYRLPDLLSQNESTEASPANEVHPDMEPEESGLMIAPMTPPTHASTAPMTAPPAATTTPSDPNNSPSFPRWIFNNLSRRWTSIRERWGTRQNITTDASMNTASVPLAASPTPAIPPTVPAAVVETPGAADGGISSSLEAYLSRPRSPPLRRAHRGSLGPHRPPRRRRTSHITQPALAAPLPQRRPVAASTTQTKRPYDLFPAGFSQELLDRCYARSTKIPTKSPGTDEAGDINAAQVTPPLEDVDTSSGSAIPTSTDDQSLKRKREPETIPNPKGCSYGLDLDYFEFTDEEWAEEEKRQAALNAAKELASPVTKKQRVGDRKEQRRRLTARTTASNVSPSVLTPSRSPGFIPNRRGTYQAPDLPTIDSSALMTDSAPPVSEPPSSAAPVHVAAPSSSARNSHEVSKESRPESITPPAAGTKRPSTPGRKALPNARSVGMSHSFRNITFFVAAPDEFPMVIPEGRRVLTNTKGTFQCPGSDDSEEDREYLQFSPRSFKEEKDEREFNKFLRHLALECDKPRVVTRAEMIANSRLFSDVEDLNPDERRMGQTLLAGRQNMVQNFPRREEYLKPKFIIYPGGAYRAYTPELDQPLYCSDRWGQKRLFLTTPLEQPSSPTSANSELQSEPADHETTEGAQAHESAAVVPTAEATNVANHTEASDTAPDGPSPLTRARNKAEQFKPKTPSRLREAHHFSSSLNSLKTGTPSYLSDPMSLDDTLNQVPTADDIDWLHELCPTGDVSSLVWPEKASLVETLGLDPSAVAIVDSLGSQQKVNEAVQVWKDVFGTFVENDLEL